MDPYCFLPTVTGHTVYGMEPCDPPTARPRRWALVRALFRTGALKACHNLRGPAGPTVRHELYRVVVLGAGKVGKTTLCAQAVGCAAAAVPTLRGSTADTGDDAAAGAAPTVAEREGLRVNTYVLAGDVVDDDNVMVDDDVDEKLDAAAVLKNQVFFFYRRCGGFEKSSFF